MRKVIILILLLCAVYLSADSKENMKITINITSGSGNHTITAALADNSSARAMLLLYLPL